jgi:hypothetical protein
MLSWYWMPWRLATLFVGLALLLVGAEYYHFPDWDVGISLLMALVSYGLMPRFQSALLQRDWLQAGLIVIFCVDTTYTAYLQAMDMTLELRWVNFGASAGLFAACWVVWCVLPLFWQGQLWAELTAKARK